MNLKKLAWVFVVAIPVGLYTAFVAMYMWNWFAVRVLHVPTISFLEMVGLVWLISLFIERPDRDEFRWKGICAAIEVCVPDHKREELADALNQINENLWSDIWKMIFAQLAGNTALLAFGFGLHVLIS